MHHKTQNWARKIKILNFEKFHGQPQTYPEDKTLLADDSGCLMLEQTI